MCRAALSSGPHSVLLPASWGIRCGLHFPCSWSDGGLAILVGVRLLGTWLSLALLLFFNSIPLNMDCTLLLQGNVMMQAVGEKVLCNRVHLHFCTRSTAVLQPRALAGWALWRLGLRFDCLALESWDLPGFVVFSVHLCVDSVPAGVRYKETQ